MKIKKIIYYVMFVPIFIGSIMCKKGSPKSEITNSIIGPQESSISIVTFPDLLQAELQLRRLAHGFASLVENSDVNKYGDESYMYDLNYFIPNGSHEIYLTTFHDKLLSTPWGAPTKFKTLGSSGANTDDNYQAINFCINKYNPPTAFSPSWNPDFYSSCIIGTTRYNTVIRIPQFSTSKYYYNKTINNYPILFIGNSLTKSSPYIGYYWDIANKKIKELKINNDDELDDIIDNKSYYVVVLDIDPIDTKLGGKGEKLFSNCGEKLVCGDGYCDKRCNGGEPDNCIDCNNKQTNAILKLVEIKIDEDKRVIKGSGGTDASDCYFVDNLGGKYKLKLNALVVHSNNQWEALKDLKIRPKWEQSEVKRTRENSSGWLRKTKSRGQETWKKVWALGDDDAEANGSGIVLSEHFNILKSYVYISISEEDNFMGKNRSISGPISPYFNYIVPIDFSWKSQFMPTLTGPNKTGWYKDDLKNKLPLDLLDASSLAIPSYWFDSATNTYKQAIVVQGTNISYKLVVE